MTPAERNSTIDLIEQEIPRLRRFARYLARDIDYADDLVQECLLRAIEKIDSWTPGTNLRAWLFVILKNIFKNDLRRDGRITLRDPRNDAELTVAVPAAQEARMALLEVKEAFLTLPDEHREVLALVGIEGLKYEEVALILDVPVGTIRSRLSRARNALKDAVGDVESEPEQRRKENPDG